MGRAQRVFMSNVLFPFVAFVYSWKWQKEQISQFASSCALIFTRVVRPCGRKYGHNIDKGVVQAVYKWPHICWHWPSFCLTFADNNTGKHRACENDLGIPKTTVWEIFEQEFRNDSRVYGDWLLHHDNAPAYKSNLRQQLLPKHKIVQLRQPPYSPDIAPCDFWMFPKLEMALKGKDSE